MGWHMWRWRYIPSQSQLGPTPNCWSPILSATMVKYVGEVYLLVTVWLMLNFDNNRRELVFIECQQHPFLIFQKFVLGLISINWTVILELFCVIRWLFHYWVLHFRWCSCSSITMRGTWCDRHALGSEKYMTTASVVPLCIVRGRPVNLRRFPTSSLILNLAVASRIT